MKTMKDIGYKSTEKYRKLSEKETDIRSYYPIDDNDDVCLPSIDFCRLDDSISRKYRTRVEFILGKSDGIGYHEGKKGNRVSVSIDFNLDQIEAMYNELKNL